MRRAIRTQCLYETRQVLAGAYRGKDVSERTLHSHAVIVDAEGRELLVVCRGPKLDSMADSYADDVTALPSCPTCAERVARWGVKNVSARTAGPK